MNDISQSIKKIDSDVKALGKAIYTSDIKMDGMLYAKTVRSKHQKAKILNINYPALPKGYFVVDHRDIPGENIVKIIFDDMPIFAKDEVNYYLEPIALIVGPEKEVIEELVSQVHVEYEILDAVFEYKNSVVNYHFTKGDIKKAKQNADREITFEYTTGYQEQLYIEPQGMIGYFENEVIHLVGSLQCPYYVKNAVISALNCKEDYIKVIASNVGGAFGGKEEFPSLMGTELAVAVHKIKKPIKLIFEREEDMEVTTKRHPAKITLTGYIKDNDIIGMSSNVGMDAGAYIGLSGVVLSRALIASTGAYTVENLEVNGDVFITNTVPNGAFRGFGAPQMLFAVEMFIHHIAKELAIDPLELRKIHLAKQGDKTSTNGLFRDPIIMTDMLQKVLTESSYVEKVKAYENKDVNRGIGMSWFLHGCGFTGSGEQTHINAVVKLRKDEFNFVHILIAAVDMGQGVETTMCKIVSHVLEIPIEQVIYGKPDTSKVPDSGPTVASRTIMIVGGLVARAAKRLKEEWEDQMEQVITEKYKHPEYIEWDEITFSGDAYPAYSWGISIVEVEVDTTTYQVDVLETWSVFDVGKAIDERIIIGQADGGLLQGLGYGYLEVMKSIEGKIAQKNVTDYIIPSSVDIPLMHTYIIDNPYPLGPYGAKGAGELPLIGGAPAVALAIENAIGKKIMKIPATPEYIMELMNDERN